jgi:sRNA-binding protein
MREKALQMREEAFTEKALENFKNLCEYYDIPTFTMSDAKNHWEQEFLQDIKERMCSDKDLSDRQLQQLIKILKEDIRWQDKPTERQLKYIISLGGDPELVISKHQASTYISKLKGEK